MKIEDWKHIPYSEAWERQTELFNSIIKARSEGQPYENRIIFCTHPHVYTIGKHGKQENMLISDDMLSRIGAEVFRIDRGGDITYHGPGQQVCYPILCLEDFKLGLKGYLHQLEEAVIRTCNPYLLALRNKVRQGRRCYRSVDRYRNSARKEDLCDGSQEQPFCNHARSGA